jgi:hypothetical protein
MHTCEIMVRFLGAFFSRLREGHPADYRARHPATGDEQIEIEQPLEVPFVFEAAVQMSAQLHAARHDAMKVYRHAEDRNDRDD